MPEEPTELDKLREGYVVQIIQAVNDPGNQDGGRFMVDWLLAEWGSKAYHAGRRDLAQQVQKLA